MSFIPRFSLTLPPPCNTKVQRVMTLSPLFHYLQSQSSVLQILVLHIEMNLLNRCVFGTWNWQTNWETSRLQKEKLVYGRFNKKRETTHYNFFSKTTTHYIWSKKEIKRPKKTKHFAWERQLGLTGSNLPQRQKFHWARSLTETKTQATFGP